MRYRIENICAKILNIAEHIDWHMGHVALEALLHNIESVM